MTPATAPLGAALLLASSLSSGAATVTETDPAVFAFDSSGLGTFQITSAAYACLFGADCSSDVGLLSTGATLQVTYGTTPGGTEIATRAFTNTFNIAINNAAGSFVSAPPVAVAATVDTVYASFRYVDDAYAVTDFRMFTTLGALNGVLTDIPELQTVPLPASGWLLLLGLGALGLRAPRAIRAGAPRAEG